MFLLYKSSNENSALQSARLATNRVLNLQGRQYIWEMCILNPLPGAHGPYQDANPFPAQIQSEGSPELRGPPGQEDLIATFGYPVQDSRCRQRVAVHHPHLEPFDVLPIFLAPLIQHLALHAGKCRLSVEQVHWTGEEGALGLLTVRLLKMTPVD